MLNLIADMKKEHAAQYLSYLQQWDAELQWIVWQATDNFLNETSRQPNADGEFKYSPYKLFLEVASHIVDVVCEREEKTGARYKVPRRELATIMWDERRDSVEHLNIRDAVMTSAPHLVKAVVDRIHNPAVPGSHEMYINFSDGFCNPHKLEND